MENATLVCFKHDRELVRIGTHEYGPIFRCPEKRCHVKVIVFELAEEVMEFDQTDNCEGNCEECDDLKCKEMQLEAEAQDQLDDDLGIKSDGFAIDGDDNGYTIYPN